jgi:hypothetical protein
LLMERFHGATSTGNSVVLMGTLMRRKSTLIVPIVTQMNEDSIGIHGTMMRIKITTGRGLTLEAF